MFFLHFGVHGLDDDDGVIEDDTDSKYQRKQGGHVDRKSEHLYEDKSSDERDRHRERGNQRGAPVAKENKTTNATRIKASRSVSITFSIEASRKFETS